MNRFDENSSTVTLPSEAAELGRPRRADERKTIRVLVLDDHEDDFEMVKLLLRKNLMASYALQWAPDEVAALRVMRSQGCDVALFDYKLAGTTGLEIMRTLQAQRCDIPIILLTGSENPAVDQAALDAGAADYLCKSSLDTTRLERAIRYSINHAHMLAALRDSQAQLQLFMQSVPCAVGIYDDAGVVLFQNDIFRRHFPAQAVMTVRGIAAASRSPVPYSDGVRHWLITTFPMVEHSGRNLRGLAGIDITQLRLMERELLRVSDLEKERIGGDLHDGLGQYLTGISCLSAALRDKLQGEGRPEAVDAATISTLVQEAIAQARALARGLCPVQLETSGLETALEDLTFQVQRLHGLECAFVPRGTVDADPGRALHLYRIAQEAINNAIKHASARRIVVTADFSHAECVLAIEDDGCGFDPGIEPGRGSGMNLMPYRAAMIGGTLSVTSTRHSGTRVECRFQQPA